MYTKFFDMSSGGGEKEDWAIIVVNLPLEEAVKWFENEFGHDPYNITCDCCGPDYYVSEHQTLEETQNQTYSYKYFEI